MPDFVCNFCHLKADSKVCHVCKTDNHTYIVNVLTTEEIEDILSRKRKLHLESVNKKKH